MTIQDIWDSLRKNWSKNPPIDDVAAFDSIEQAIGQRLPSTYKFFLMESNGGETLEPLPRIRLYGLEQLKADEVSDLLEIASYGRDAYGFDLTVNRDSAGYPIVKYSLDDTDRRHIHRISRDFEEFLARIACGDELEWRARVELLSASADAPTLHPCDLPEGTFAVRSMWKAIMNSWSGDPRIVDASEFDGVEKALGQDLPSDYKWFLMKSNGGETLEPLEHVTLYGLQELLPRRADGQPPDVLEIATNDSDGYAFDLTMNRDNASYPVVRYSLGEDDRAYIERVSRDFAEFLAIIASGEEP
jgi:hypothetical protein